MKVPRKGIYRQNGLMESYKCIDIFLWVSFRDTHAMVSDSMFNHTTEALVWEDPQYNLPVLAN